MALVCTAGQPRGLGEQGAQDKLHGELCSFGREFVLAGRYSKASSQMKVVCFIYAFILYTLTGCNELI